MVKSGRKKRGVTTMLIGEYEHSLDAKGRLILPAKLREDIGDKFIVTKGLDGCLFAFSVSEWQNFEQKLRTLPISNKKYLKTLVFSNILGTYLLTIFYIYSFLIFFS